MAKEENPGLLSKVVKFVRNPTTNWADLDQQEADKESSYSKQMLKEMIERKRRNDFVRKREFDMLRKMRQREAMSGQDPMARPSFFQSSLPNSTNADGRAKTLKKIDEIEAQMSMQWWKTKHGESPRSSNFPVSSLPPGGDSSSPPANSPSPDPNSSPYAPTQTSPLMPSGEPRQSPGMIRRDVPVSGPSSPVLARPAPTGAGRPAPRGDAPPPPSSPALAARAASGSRPSAGQTPPVGIKPPLGVGGLAASYEGSATTGFSASKLFAIEVDDFAHDPELEEAAIRFANGDDAGAEAGLRDAIGPTGTRGNHEETWLTLFDLYRATGQQHEFESLALDYAGRFDRTSPPWYSLPDLAGMQPASKPPVKNPTTGAPVCDWICPHQMSSQTVTAMVTQLARLEQPWRLDWTGLQTIQDDAAGPLAEVLEAWSGEPLQLRFMGAEQFDALLVAATPSGDKSVDQVWWQLRLQVLRLTHRPDEFELAALDFCVTYEVSPPSWENAQCQYRALASSGSTMAGQISQSQPIGDSGDAPAGYGDTQLVGFGATTPEAPMGELVGEIFGDATEALNRLDHQLFGAQVMVVSCARVVRVDFSAAGSLLNWANARAAEGRSVQFVAAHRLVAAFFNAIGISEHARVFSNSV